MAAKAIEVMCKKLYWGPSWSRGGYFFSGSDQGKALDNVPVAGLLAFVEMDAMSMDMCDAVIVKYCLSTVADQHPVLGVVTNPHQAEKLVGL